MLRAHSPRRTAGLVAGACVALALASCTSSPSSAEPGDPGSEGGGGGNSSSEPAPERFSATLVNPASGHGVPVDTRVAVRADSGTFRDVVLYRGQRSPEHMIGGRMSADGGTWRADELLEPDATYTVVSRGTAEAGARTVRNSFTTQPLTLDQQTYPSVARASAFIGSRPSS